MSGAARLGLGPGPQARCRSREQLRAAEPEAVTCICFGQERLHKAVGGGAVEDDRRFAKGMWISHGKAYVLLATASKASLFCDLHMPSPPPRTHHRTGRDRGGLPLLPH